MDAEDDVRAGEIDQVGVAGGILGVAWQPVVGGGKVLGLEHRAPAAIQDRDPLVEEFCQFAHHAPPVGEAPLSSPFADRPRAGPSVAG